MQPPPCAAAAPPSPPPPVAAVLAARTWDTLVAEAMIAAYHRTPTPPRHPLSPVGRYYGPILPFPRCQGQCLPSRNRAVALCQRHGKLLPSDNGNKWDWFCSPRMRCMGSLQRRLQPPRSRIQPQIGWTQQWPKRLWLALAPHPLKDRSTVPPRPESHAQSPAGSQPNQPLGSQTNQSPGSQPNQPPGPQPNQS
jgi:hypothetical protein